MIEPKLNGWDSKKGKDVPSPLQLGFKFFVKIEDFKFQVKNNVKFLCKFQFFLKIMKFRVPVGRGGLCSSIALNLFIITKPLMKDINGHMTIRMA